MKKLLVCIAISTVLFTGCSFTQKRNGIIKVNGHVITQAEFDKEFDKSIDNSMFKSFGGAKNFVKTEENPMYNVFKEKVVNELIIKALIEEEVKKRDIKVTKDEVHEELKKVIDKVGSKDELNRILKERKISNAQFTEDLKTQIKMRKLIDSVEKVDVTEADAKKYYDTHQQEFTHGEQVRASHILIATDVIGKIRELKEKNPNISPEKINAEIEKYVAAQEAKAKEVLAEVKKNPENFESIAAQKSDDKGSAARGGQLGFFTKEAMVPEFADAAFSMKPNTISDLVVTQYGYHIIKVTDRMEAGVTPFVKVKDELRFYLETKQQIAILKKLTSSLMKSADIEYLNASYNPAKSVNVLPDPKEAKTAEPSKK